MSKVISREQTNYFAWGDNCDGWHLIENDQLSVVQETMPPNTSEIKHYHEKAQQLFYILQGEAEIEIEGKKIIAKAGEAVHINAVEHHNIRNNAAEDLAFILISTPSTADDRIDLNE